MMLKLALLTLLCACALAAVVKNPPPAPISQQAQNILKPILSKTKLPVNKSPAKPVTSTVTGGSKVNQAQQANRLAGPQAQQKSEGSQPRMLQEGARRRLKIPEVYTPPKEEEPKKVEEIPSEVKEPIPKITPVLSEPREDSAGLSLDGNSGSLSEEETDLPEKETDLSEEETDLPEKETDLSEEEIDIPKKKNKLPEKKISHYEEEIKLPEKKISHYETNIKLPKKKISHYEEEIELPEKETDLSEEEIKLPKKKNKLPEKKISHYEEEIKLPGKKIDRRPCDRRRGCRRNCWSGCHCGWQVHCCC